MQNGKSKILLINSNLIKPPIAPIGLDYIAGALIAKGFEPVLLDLNFSDDIKKDILKKLNNNSFLAIGVSIRNSDDCYFLSRDNFLPEAKNIINTLKKYSNSPIIIGGSGFSIMPGAMLSYLGGDYGVIGDGEYNFFKLAEAIREGKAIDGLKGVIYHNYTNSASPYNSLDVFPLPYRDFVDNRKYFREGGMGSIETKRGCGRKCIYCADPLIKGSNVRVRPINNLINEMRNLLKKGINYLHFCDSEFNSEIAHAEELIDEMIDNNLGKSIKWYTYMSPVPFSETFAKKLRNAGCTGINFGIDSADLKILKNLNRRHKPQDIKRVAELCKKYGIKFMFDLLVGGPGENKKSIKYTIEYVKKLNPTCAGISYGIRIYPGTILSQLVKKNIKNKDYKKNIFGNYYKNLSFLNPIFYISEELGAEIVEYTNSIIEDDKRFFIGASESSKKNYNYNKNQKLQEAIRQGQRGAYWDILQNV